jgi:hypothetical protein
MTSATASHRPATPSTRMIHRYGFVFHGSI